MPHVIRVRDVARGGVYDLTPDEPILRGPYELFHPDGPVLRRGPLVEYEQSGEVRRARVSPSTAGDVHPGERVLSKVGPRVSADDSEDEWWLCDVVSVDGIEGED